MAKHESLDAPRPPRHEQAVSREIIDDLQSSINRLTDQSTVPPVLIRTIGGGVRRYLLLPDDADQGDVFRFTPQGGRQQADDLSHAYGADTAGAEVTGQISVRTAHTTTNGEEVSFDALISLLSDDRIIGITGAKAPSVEALFDQPAHDACHEFAAVHGLDSIWKAYADGALLHAADPRALSMVDRSVTYTDTMASYLLETVQTYEELL